MKNDDRSRWPLVATILASSMAFVDGSALNVALSAIQKDLQASGSDLLWIVNGYNLPVSALILLGGSLGDRFGVKKIFMIGITLFLLASAACGLAPNTFTLICARVIQGLGGALLIPSSLSFLTLSTDDAKRGKIIGTWSSFSTLTTIMGPILGGVLSGWGIWRGVFYLNLPLGLAALWILKYKTDSSIEAPKGGRIDYGGAFLITIGLGLLSGGLLLSDKTKLGYPLALLSVLFLASFIFWEKRQIAPMLPLNIFHSRVFTSVNLVTILLYSTLYGVLLFVPMNLIQIQHYPDGLAGAASLPFAFMIMLLSPLAGRILDQRGPRLLLTVGPIVVGFGFIVMSFIGVTSSMSQYWVSFFPAYILLGMGMGLTIAPLTTTVMTALPKNQAGVASGVNNAASRVAGVLAVAVLGLVFVNLFSTGIKEKLAKSTLSEAQRNVIEKEAPNLAALVVPTEWPKDLKEKVHLDIKTAFVYSFNWVSLIAAVLCVLSGLFAFFTLRASRKGQWRGRAPPGEH